MAVSFAKKTLLAKATSRPDLAMKVLEKAQTDGVLQAWRAAQSRLDKPLALGYSAAGIIVELGEGITDLTLGQAVACAGAGHAAHAEYIAVPRNLVAAIPEGLAFEEAAAATVATIALHGFRLAEPTLGETVCVIGLGLVGLFCAQIARAAGCRVIGIDLLDDRIDLAKRFGVELTLNAAAGSDVLAMAVNEATRGRGADAVLVAAATESSEPMITATAVARDRARIVMVGAAGMELARGPFFQKEVSFSVSRSYGPGRYDPKYEDGGSDYPIGYVRWTEGRNMEAVLELMGRGELEVAPLVSHRFDIAEAEKAYELITAAATDSLGVLLSYPSDEKPRSRRVDVATRAQTASNEPGIGLIGAGNFATVTLLPALQAAGTARLTGVCTASGVSAQHAARKFGFDFATTDVDEILSDDRTEAIVIATRHDRHADELAAVLRSKRHVFCEKPLCLNVAELSQVVAQWRAHEGRCSVLVGFNRRFSPMARQLRDYLGGGAGAYSIQYRVNAGALPANHWTRDRAIGGGRLIGEVCHFIDFISFLTSAEPKRVRAVHPPTADEDLHLTLEMTDGSVASIAYVAQGGASLPKEWIEVHRSGRSGVLDNFRALALHGSSGRPKKRKRGQDKGHRALMAGWVESLRGGQPLISFRSIVATTLATFAAEESIKSGRVVELDVDHVLDPTHSSA